MANFLFALVSAELSLFGVEAATPAFVSVADDTPADSTPRFDSAHYRSALG